MTSESSIEARLGNCCEKIKENIVVLDAFMADNHIVDVDKLLNVAQNIHLSKPSEILSMCENTKRSIDVVINIINYEKRRRNLSDLLKDKTMAREKKMEVRNRSRFLKRQRYFPYQTNTGSSSSIQTNPVHNTGASSSVEAPLEHNIGASSLIQTPLDPITGEKDDL